MMNDGKGMLDQRRWMTDEDEEDDDDDDDDHY